MYVYLLIFITFFYSIEVYSDEIVTGSTGPQNARSRVYNEFNTTTYCSPPPKRSECKSYVSGNGTFDEAAFNAKGKNRPCNVNRQANARDISDPTNGLSYGKNYAVYSTDNPNKFELDIPITFYIGNLSGNRIDNYKDFEKKALDCVKNNPIKLHDGTRSLKLNLLPRYSNDRSPKDDFNKTPVARSIWGVSLFDSKDRFNSRNYGLNISCTALVHEMLHVTGLHDEYHETKKYRPNKNIYEKNLGATFDSSLFEQGLLDQRKFDCRKKSDFGKDNVMNDERLFDLKVYKLGYTFCYPQKTGASGIQVSTSTTNVSVSKFQRQRRCNKGDRAGNDGTAGGQADLDWLDNYQKNLNKEKGTSDPFYIAYYERKTSDLPPSLTKGQFSSILFPNCLSRPEVRTYANHAKNAYRNKHLPTDRKNGCRK